MQWPPEAVLPCRVSRLFRNKTSGNCEMARNCEADSFVNHAVNTMSSRSFFTKVMNSLFASYLSYWMIKLFMNREQISILNSKYIDLDWYYSRLYGKLK